MFVCFCCCWGPLLDVEFSLLWSLCDEQMNSKLSFRQSVGFSIHHLPRGMCDYKGEDRKWWYLNRKYDTFNPLSLYLKSKVKSRSDR